MKLLNIPQLTESKVETIFANKHSYEVSTLIKLEDLSKIDATNETMKESKDVENSTSLSPSAYTNGQIETLNGASPKSTQKILDVNKSPFPVDVTVKKVTIPPEWKKLNSSSSDESAVLSREGTEKLNSSGENITNGIPDEKKSDFLPEEEFEKNSIGFDFADDNEKFGLSEAEVDKLLKDVEEKDKTDVLESTNPDDRKENGIDKDSSNETFIAAAQGTSEKSGSLADMLLSNFERKLQSGLEICIKNDIFETNHGSEKETVKTQEVPKVFDKSNSMDESSTNSTEHICDNKEQTVDTRISDIVPKNVEENSLVTEKVIENGVETDDELKQDSLGAQNGDESSHISSIEHESKCSDKSCISKQDEFKAVDSCNQKATDGLESSEELDKLFDEDKTSNLSESDRLRDDSENGPSNKTELLKSSSDLPDGDSYNDKSAEIENNRNDSENKSSDDGKAVNMQLSEAQFDETTDVDMKNSGAVETGDGFDSEMKVSEPEVDMVDNSEKCDESVIETEVSENSTDSEIQHKSSEFELNTDKLVNFPTSESNNVQDETQNVLDSEKNISNVVPHTEEIETRETDEKVTREFNSDKKQDADNIVPIDKENTLVQSEHAVDDNEAERLLRKRTCLENDDERGIKRTKVIDSEVSSDQKDEMKKVQHISESSNEMDCSERTDESKVNSDDGSVNKIESAVKKNDKSSSKANTSDIVGDNQMSKEGEKTHSDKNEVQDNESETVRSGTKRTHEQVGIIEVKKVRITPEIENQLSKLSTSEKLKKSDINKGDKSESTKDQNDQLKQIDKDISKDKEKLSGKEEESEEKGKVTDDKSDENDKLGNDKSSEKKNEDVEEATLPSEQKNSLPPTAPKSNLDLAIERVVMGVTDTPENDTEVEKSKKNLNSMPFMQNLQDNLLKKLSRHELEEFLVQKICEVITDRCTIGDMRKKSQTLENMLEQWRKKVQQLQKQLTDMEMVMKRYIGDARTRKERPVPVKITRSVGLQVHMGTMNPGMLRNRPFTNEPLRNPGQVRRRANRVSSPSGTTQQNQSPAQPQQQQQQQPQQQQQQQHQQSQQQQAHQQSPRQMPQIVGGTTATPVTVQKVVPPAFRKITPNSSPQASSPNMTTVAQMSANKGPKLTPPTVKPVGRPITSIAAAIASGSATSTINTMNNTVVNTTNNLRIASAAQLNNRQPAKQTSQYSPPKSGDLKVIDLTDEEDRGRAGNMRAVGSSNMISTSISNPVPIAPATSIQTGSIRVVQPHQLTGSTTTTLLTPSTPTSANSRLAYLVPSTVGGGQQRQVFIASSGPTQVRPGVMNVQNRQNQLPTLVFKNGTVVPVHQASGTQSVNPSLLRPSPPMQAGQIQQVLATRPGQIRVTPNLVSNVGRMTAPTVTNVPVLASKHPAPLPNPPQYQPNNPRWKLSPPKPELKISKGANKHQQGIVLSWNMSLTSDHEEIASYQLYAYQEGAAQPSTNLWKKVGDVKALPLPMACTLTQFMEGHKYHFAVRAVDVHMRVGPFSIPGNIVLTRK